MAYTGLRRKTPLILDRAEHEGACAESTVVFVTLGRSGLYYRNTSCTLQVLCLVLLTQITRRYRTGVYVAKRQA